MSPSGIVGSTGYWWQQRTGLNPEENMGVKNASPFIGVMLAAYYVLPQ